MRSLPLSPPDLIAGFIVHGCFLCRVVHNEVIEGSVDNYFQAARMAVLQVQAPNSDARRRAS